jgi:hypothetical protein
MPTPSFEQPRTPFVPAPMSAPVPASSPVPRTGMPAFMPSMPAMPVPAPVAAPAREARNGLGLAAVILGPIAILFGLIPLTGIVAVGVGIVGLALGLAGVGRLRRRRATNKIGTTLGVVLSAIGLALGIYGLVVMFQATNQLVEDLNGIPAPPSISAPAN